MGDERFCGSNRPHEVRVDDAHDLLVSRPFERTGHPVAGVVENHVDAASGDGLCHRRLDLLSIRDVQRKQDDAGKLRQLDLVARVAHGGDDLPASRREQPGRGSSETRRASGDENGSGLAHDAHLIWSLPGVSCVSRGVGTGCDQLWLRR
jgi:hypothetical protein